MVVKGILDTCIAGYVCGATNICGTYRNQYIIVFSVSEEKGSGKIVSTKKHFDVDMIYNIIM